MFWCDVVGKAGEIHGSFSTEVESQPGRRLTVRFSLSPSSPISSRETATRDLKVATPHREAAVLWWSSRPASLEAERAAIASPVAVFISIAVVGNIKHKRLLTGPDARKGMSGWRGGRTCACAREAAWGEQLWNLRTSAGDWPETNVAMTTPRGCLKSITVAFRRLARAGDVEGLRA